MVPFPKRVKLDASTADEAVAELLAAGFWAERLHSGVKRVGRALVDLNSRGLPNVLVVQPAGYLFVGRSFSPHQMAWIQRAQSLGLRVAVVENPRKAVELVQTWA